MIHRYRCNDKGGRDYIIGDIHGQFSRVMRVLTRIGFSHDRDRLFCVGDLVDRGPESYHFTRWVDAPWFHTVRGNHEWLAIEYFNERFPKHVYIKNGGQWFIDLPKSAQQDIVEAFEKLPYVIELDTPKGIVGIVHANAPNHWSQLKGGFFDEHQQEFLVWSRTRLEDFEDRGVQGVRAVVVGHTVVPGLVTLGNVLHIDTGGWRGVEGGVNRFTVLDAETLQVVPQ